jgi:uncharacterized membrane protein
VAYWKFLHILSMFAGVTLLVGLSVFSERLIATHDVATIRRAGARFKVMEKLGIAAVSVGVVFGLIAAIVGSFDLTKTWLVIAYVLVALLFALGPLEGRRFSRVTTAAEASPDDRPSAELTAAIEDPARRRLTAVSIALYVAVIFVMVTKPFL